MVPNNNEFCEDNKKLLHRIALASHKLLTGDYSPLGKANLTDKYNNLLIKNGLASFTKSLHVQSLMAEFLRFYSSEILSFLGCEFRGKSVSDDNWILRILRKQSSVQHPIYHILLIEFLSLNVDEFFNQQDSQGFFGMGPWLCLNPASNHYRQAIITDFQPGTRSRNGRPVGIFKCNCGFQYIRSGPDTKQEDKFRIDKMLSFGSIWESKLIELWNCDSLNLSEISRRLKVDTLTVKRYAEKLHLSFERTNKSYKEVAKKDQLKAIEATESDEQCSNQKRSEWLLLIKTAPEKKLINLRKTNSQLYSWLLKYDNPWLKKNLPKTVKLAKITRPYVDWVKRDVEVVELIKKAAQTLLSAKDRPKQITTTALGKESNCLSLLLTKIEKLPKTNELVKTLVESQQTFAVRRIKFVAEQYRLKNIFYDKWQIINQACVYRMRKEPLIKNTIDEQLNLLKKNQIG